MFVYIQKCFDMFVNIQKRFETFDMFVYIQYNVSYYVIILWIWKNMEAFKECTLMTIEYSLVVKNGFFHFMIDKNEKKYRWVF